MQSQQINGQMLLNEFFTSIMNQILMDLFIQQNDKNKENIDKKLTEFFDNTMKNFDPIFQQIGKTDLSNLLVFKKLMGDEFNKFKQEFLDKCSSGIITE